MKKKKQIKKTGKWWKILIGVFASVVVVAVVGVIVIAKLGAKENNASDETTVHTHDYVLIDEVKPTCSAFGLKKYECVCGFSVTVDVQSLPHDYVLTETVNPTCTAEGANTYECACGEKYIETLPMTEHEYIYDMGSIAPTCTTEGQSIYACICGETIHEVLPIAHEWELVDSIISTSCLEHGTDTYQCTLCGAEKTEEGALGEHVDYEGEGLGPGTNYPDGICDVCGAEGKPKRTIEIETEE